MTLREEVRDLATDLEVAFSGIGWSAGDTDDVEDAINKLLDKQREIILDMIEERRRRVLMNPDDPSWTEHFAELICDIRSSQK